MTAHAGVKQQLIRISPRRELRYALLAAMESCWVYMILALFISLQSSPRGVSPLAIFLVYLLGLLAGRLLPRLPQRWIIVQLTAISIAAAALLMVVRVELYPQFGLGNWSWFALYLGNLTSFNQRLSADLISTIGVIYVYMRGLGFGQRPLTLWFIGFQFRLGIVALFLLFIFAGFTSHYDPGGWVLLYFFVSLVAIALARMEEAGSNVSFGPRWMATLVAAVAVVLFLGLAIMQLFTLQVADRIVGILAIPFAIIAGILFTVIALPVAFIVGGLIDWLRPFFDNFSGLNSALQGGLSNLQSILGNTETQTSYLDMIAPLLKVLFMLAIVVGVGVLLARVLNRRMKDAEHETYLRESIGDEEADAALRAEHRAKKRVPARRGNISAESIRRIYAALVARASDAGVPRRAAETPYEFLPRLRSAFPEQSQEIQTITDAYVAVHYAERVANPDQVSRVRRAWELVERHLRRKP